MAFEHATVVEVRAFDRTVGAIARGATRAYAFEFDPSWVSTGIQLAPLVMRSGIQQVYSFPGLDERTFHDLPPMVADSLPDRFGNAVVNAWLATQGVVLSEITELDRLTYLGARGMGALEYWPVNGPDAPPAGALVMSDLVRTAREAVQGTLATDDESSAALRQIFSVGTSAGGARAKAIVEFDPVTRQLRAGDTTEDPAFQAWLLKFDGIGEDGQLGPGLDYGRVEFAYSVMARAAGIRMTETRLLEEQGRAHFMTRRFDRTDHHRKLHSQTLTGLAAIDYNAIGVNDYAQLFTTIDELGLPDDARTEAFRRMVFNYAAANCDDHAKNHGFLMDDDGTWSLSPAYDVTHAYNPSGAWTFQHLMGINGRFADIGRNAVIEFGERHGVARIATVLGEVDDALDSWPQFAAQAGLSPARADAVSKDFSPISTWSA